MNINPSNLASTLKKQHFDMVILSGDDTDQVDEVHTQLLTHYHSNGFEIDSKFTVDRSTNLADVIQAICNESLFINKQLFVLSIEGAPGLLLNELIDTYADRASPSKAIIIKTGQIKKADKQRKWYKKLDQRALIVTIWPLQLAEQITWLRQWCKNHDYECSQATISLIAQKNHGNHAACKQTLERLKLALPNGAVDEEQALPYLFNQAEYALHQLMGHCLNGQINSLMGILSTVDINQYPINLLLWNIGNELKICSQLVASTSREAIYRSHRIWPSRKANYETAIRHLDNPLIFNWLNHLAWLDQNIKNGRLATWEDHVTHLLICITQREPMALADDQ